MISAELCLKSLANVFSPPVYASRIVTPRRTPGIGYPSVALMTSFTSTRARALRRSFGYRLRGGGQLALSLVFFGVSRLCGALGPPEVGVEDLGVVLYSLEGAVYAAEDPLQFHLKLDLGLDALDVQLHLVHVGVDAHVYVQKSRELRPGRNVGPQLVDLEVELLDVEHGDVEDDVGVVGGIGPHLLTF
jgi:hypothetical protein